jgi:hypothetical protein
MIPKNKELYLPLFRVLRRYDEISLKDVAKIIAVDMDLSDEVTNYEAEKGTNIFLTRLSSTLTKFKNEKLVFNVKGLWKLSDEGLKITLDEFMEVFNIEDSNIKRKTGNENFVFNEEILDIKLLDFGDGVNLIY